MGISLVRALLPIIVQRSELVEAIVIHMKQYVLCETTVFTALPILLLLLRSSTARAAVRDDQFSQSFATFSTQVFSNHFYRMSTNVHFLFQTLNAMGVPLSGRTEVALEITSVLSRSLSQAAETRALLYKYDADPHNFSASRLIRVF